MKKTFILLATALLGVCAFASIDCLTLGYGDTVNLLAPAKVVGIEVVGSGTATPKRETLVLGSRNDVTTTYFTNFTYSVVTTNSPGAFTTNVLSRPHPLPMPDNLASYWTNTIVTTFTYTNTVPIVSAAVTNEVATNVFLAAGDKLFTPSTDTFRGKLLIFIER